MSVAITDLMPPSEWHRFETELHERFFMNCTVYNAEGVGVTGRPTWCNSLCPEIKANPGALATICAACNQYFMAQAKKTGGAVIDECDAGLLKIAVPIFVGDSFVGTAGGCGRLPAGGEVDTFIIQKTTDLEVSVISALCSSLTPMERSESRGAAEYIAMRLEEIVGRFQGKG